MGNKKSNIVRIKGADEKSAPFSCLLTGKLVSGMIEESRTPVCFLDWLSKDRFWSAIPVRAEDTGKEVLTFP